MGLRRPPGVLMATGTDGHRPARSRRHGGGVWGTPASGPLVQHGLGVGLLGHRLDLVAQPGQQRTGIGQGLIGHGLQALRTDGTDIAVTYGDPSFYGRVGFKAMSQTDMAAPQPLQQPQGWIGLSLTRQPLTPVRGPCRCAAAFDDPAFW